MSQNTGHDSSSPRSHSNLLLAGSASKVRGPHRYSPCPPAASCMHFRSFQEQFCTNCQNKSAAAFCSHFFSATSSFCNRLFCQSICLSRRLSCLSVGPFPIPCLCLSCAVAFQIGLLAFLLAFAFAFPIREILRAFASAFAFAFLRFRPRSTGGIALFFAF